MGKCKKQNIKFLTAATVAAVATSAVVVTAPVTTEASSITDINSSQYFYNDIIDLQARGIISGYEDGTFKPGNNLTRGQAAKIIAGVLNLDTTNVVNPNFKDIPTTHQYYGAIAALKQAGIIDGYEDGTFRQGENIQRNHVAKILASALNLKASNVDSLPFTDVRADYKEAIAALYENNVTTGKTATTFDGVSNVTRGQIAAFITRAEKASQIAEDQTVTFTLENYTSTLATINGTDYTYDASVKSIFASQNRAALKGAVITATIENGVIKKINNITLNAAGTSNTFVTLNATTSVDTITINADYVAVNGLTVAGDATLTSNVVNEVKLDGVTIQGNLIVDEALVGAIASLDNTFAKDGKKGSKVKMENSKVGKVHVKRDNVAIESNVVIPNITVAATVEVVNIDGTVTKITVESTKKLEITGTANIAEVVLTSSVELTLKVSGVVNALVVASPDAKVTVGTNLKVETLKVPEGSKADGIIANYAEVAARIVSVIIGGTTSTGGAGAPSTPTPAPAPETKPVVSTTDTAEVIPNPVTIGSVNVKTEYGTTFITTTVKNVEADAKAMVKIVSSTNEIAATQPVAVVKGELYAKFENLTADTYVVEITVGDVTSKQSFTVAKVDVTKEALTQAITAAQAVEVVATADSAEVVMAGSVWTTQAAKEAFTATKAAAQVVTTKEDATQAEIDAAVMALNIAVEVYEAAKQEGSKDVIPPTIKSIIATVNDKEVTAVDNKLTVTQGSKTIQVVITFSEKISVELTDIEAFYTIGETTAKYGDVKVEDDKLIITTFQAEGSNGHTGEAAIVVEGITFHLVNKEGTTLLAKNIKDLAGNELKDLSTITLNVVEAE